MRARDPARDRPRPPRARRSPLATARTSGASSRSTFVDRPPRDPRRPVGLDVARADDGAPALRRRRSGSSSTRRGTASAGAPCSSCRCSSSGRTSTAPSSSAPALTVLLGVVELVRARRLAWIPLALVVLAPLCVLASPYGTKLVAYYDLMLVDAPFAPILREWQWSRPERDDRALLAARDRRRRRCSRCAAAGAASRSTSSPSSP